MSNNWDAIVVGAGPAGMAAATLLSQHKARTLLVDEQSAPGGQIYRATEANRDQTALLKVLGDDYVYGNSLSTRFLSSGTTYYANAAVWQITPGGEVWITRVGRAEKLNARNIILATGAMERPVPVRGWTLPGVMTIGALQVMLKSARLVPADPLVLAGCGPLFYLFAYQCLAAGARPLALLDTTPNANMRAAAPLLPQAFLGEGWRYLAKGIKLMAGLQGSGVPIFRGVSDLKIEGSDCATSVSFASRGRTHHVPCRLVALHEGVIPHQQLPRSIGCEFEWDDSQRCFRPKLDQWGHTTIEGIFVAGDSGGIVGARASEHSGELAALAVLERLGVLSTGERDTASTPALKARKAHLTSRRFLDRLYVPRQDILNPPDDVVVCRCENVHAGAIRLAVRQGCLGPNQTKTFLRCGMGPCQGRICGPTVVEIISRATQRSPEAVGYYRIRSPIKPVTLGQLAALDQEISRHANQGQDVLS
ncbi:NAD(P)/FAD-dependent oxidoreductase [Microvirga brassicacearum]|uniref:FAD-binding protein n=1 Tax=Microvirga brassicacearum TaxID=2580413 RepID=A0A5N3PBY8_9HYPH|nr:NAD(P)/FAD-dependent oxidoreductase [Microvirga brassicacearum]KAB0267223.1 FAD-binding protein [Microvirga brassicacearum]